MDEIAREGVCGLMDILAPGVRPGSDVAHLALLGYDPFVYYTGRGVFEAAGSGLKVGPNDVAFRCNFATVDENGVVVDRRAGRGTYGLDTLASLLDGLSLRGSPDIEVIFRATVGHRAALIFRGRGLSSKISDTDPGKVGMRSLESIPLDGSFEARKTASALNEFTKSAHELLKRHEINEERVKRGELPANFILSRGASVLPKLKSVSERYGFESSTCIAEVALVKGVAACVGIDIVDVPGSTGGLDTDVMAIGRAAVNSLKEKEFVFVNVKGCDVASHDKNIRGKIEMIEKIDGMVGYIRRQIDLKETIFVLTSDHSTPIEVADHSGDPVPIAIAGSPVRADDVDSFNERSVAKGGLGRIRALDLMPILLDLMGKARKFGA